MAVDTSEHFENCKRLLASGAEIEEVIKFLKKKGYPQSVSVGFLIQLGIESTTAKNAVIESDAWKENRDATKALHATIECELDKSSNCLED